MLLCNQLKIHSVIMMRDQRLNQAKQFKFTSGGTGYFNVFVHVFTKKEVKKVRTQSKK